MLSILRGATVGDRPVFLLAGHVHEDSRCGVLPIESDTSHSRAWVLESAALGGAGARAMKLPAVSVNEQGDTRGVLAPFPG